MKVHGTETVIPALITSSLNLAIPTEKLEVVEGECSLSKVLQCVLIDPRFHNICRVTSSSAFHLRAVNSQITYALSLGSADRESVLTCRTAGSSRMIHYDLPLPE